MQSQIKLLDYLIDTLKTNSNSNETTLIELKENNIHELGQYISAIANSCILEKSQQGYLIIGVEDDTLKEVGTSFDTFNLKNGNQDLELWLRNCLVATDFNFVPLVKNNKNFLIVEIYPAIGSPSKFNKIPYIRVGKNKTELSRHKELEMKLWKSFESGIFWKKVIRSELNDSEVLELLDYDSYYSLIKIPRPTQFSEICSRFEEEEFIKKNVGSWGITNLGAILFAKDLSKFSNLKFKTPRVITYDGDHKLSQAIKDIYGIKGYACGFEDLIKWIYSQIPEPEKIGDIYRDTKVTYPEKAIRELVANSLIHQDCETDGARPTIEIYKNRIEISNPGNSLVPASEIIQSIPKSRNEMMSDVMRRLYICEKRGSGIDRSIQAIEDLQLPGIKFENFEVSFLSIIYSHKDYETLSTEEKLLACEQHVILSYIKQEYANNESLRKRFGIPKNKNYVISKLVKLAKDKMLIKNADPDNYSRKHVRYIPIKG